MGALIFTLFMLIHLHDRPDLDDWMKGLNGAGTGPCCSFADAKTINDVDWDTAQECSTTAGVEECSSVYRVRLNGEWVRVPPAAVVTSPNKYGPAVVWLYTDLDKHEQIRCFLPSAMT